MNWAPHTNLRQKGTTDLGTNSTKKKVLGLWGEGRKVVLLHASVPELLKFGLESSNDSFYPTMGTPWRGRGCGAYPREPSGQAKAWAKDVAAREEAMASCNQTHGQNCGYPKCSVSMLWVLVRMFLHMYTSNSVMAPRSAGTRLGGEPPNSVQFGPSPFFAQNGCLTVIPPTWTSFKLLQYGAGGKGKWSTAQSSVGVFSHSQRVVDIIIAPTIRVLWTKGGNKHNSMKIRRRPVFKQACACAAVTG